jgi:hypothetical protein
MSREYTNKLLEMIDEGLLDPMMVVTMAVGWMSEDDVREMMEANELLGYAEKLLGYTEEDEDEYEPEGTEGYTGD